MRGDDDDEEESSLNATRYPCMPSLVALQQMRNRLHLAHLGKKLMKWTALATGRELRRLACEIDETYKNFTEDMRSAFMLVARGRYFYPNLNNIVLENVAQYASVTVATSTKSISGVKVLQLEVIERGITPYEHLGIDKGGQTIHEAKLAWLDLLKRLIVMLQQRTSFYQLEQAHKSATKRMNVLRKITIPRIKATLSYITIEMEDSSREELFRIKRIKQNKEKTKIKLDHEEPSQVCPICSQKLCGKPREASKIFVVKSKLSLKQLGETKDYTKKITSIKRMLQPVYKPKTESAITIPSRRALDPLNILSSGESNEVTKLEYLMEQLQKIISLGSSFVGKKIENININDLLIACEEVRAKIETLFQSKQIKEQPEEYLQSKLDHLKIHLHEVTVVMNELKDDVILSPSVDNFVRTCEDVDEKLNIYTKKNEILPITEETKSRLEELKSQIDDVVKVTKQYKMEEILSPNVEAFLQSCEVVKYKIDSRTQETANQAKLDHLKEHVKDLENMTTKVKPDGLLSASLDDFLKSCKDFKTKLTLRKDKDNKPPIDEGLDRLVSQIDETIELSRAARTSGLISASVEDFIKSCEDIKLRIESKQKLNTETVKPPSVLDDLEVNIDDIMQLISKFKKEGLITESMEEFIKSCEMTKATVDMHKRYPEEDTEWRTLHPTCSGSCICSVDDSLQELCERCDEIFQEKKSVSKTLAPPCNTCAGIPPPDKLDDHICESCSKAQEELEPAPPYFTPEESSEICDVCRRYLAESEEEKKQEKDDISVTSVDSTLGYFEKKVRKITRVTRTRNEDGTVREEIETIIVRKEKHDPNETIIDDDDEDFGDLSFESLIEEGEKNVAMFLAPNLNRQGFFIKSQSENFTRRSTMTEPSLRSSISANAVGDISLNDTTDIKTNRNNLPQSQSRSAIIS